MLSLSTWNNEIFCKIPYPANFLPCCRVIYIKSYINSAAQPHEIQQRWARSLVTWNHYGKYRKIQVVQHPAQGAYCLQLNDEPRVAEMKQAPVLNDREKQRMLQHLQRTSYAARNRCMLQLSWLAGMRVGEIAALNVGDVVGPNGAIRAEIQLTADQTKGDQSRTVLVNSYMKN